MEPAPAERGVLTSLDGLGLAPTRDPCRDPGHAWPRERERALGDNGSLLQLWSTGLRNLDSFAIGSLHELDLADNYELTDVDGSSQLQPLDRLTVYWSIRDNVAPDTLDIGAPETVADLAMEDNPVLSTPASLGVETFTSSISGNASAP